MVAYHSDLGYPNEMDLGGFRRGQQAGFSPTKSRSQSGLVSRGILVRKYVIAARESNVLISRIVGHLQLLKYTIRNKSRLFLMSGIHSAASNIALNGHVASLDTLGRFVVV